MFYRVGQPNYDMNDHPPGAASSATAELDSLMASLSDFKVVFVLYGQIASLSTNLLSFDVLFWCNITFFSKNHILLLYLCPFCI